MQPVVDAAKGAAHYYSDGLETYQTLVYVTGTHAVAPGKSQTYSVEGDNADLRHYLARLHRKSRCFSRSLKALWQAVWLFVYAYNSRQLKKRAHPEYRFDLIECLPAIC
jgi:insertion element IS1 protein InsB